MPDPDALEKFLEQPVVDSSAVTLRRPQLPVESGGRAGPDPTRYGDWEKDGRCIDF